MSDLVQTVKQASNNLLSVYSMVNAANPSVITHPEWINIKTVWLSKANLYKNLEETVPLFNCRDAAMKCLEKLRKVASSLSITSNPLPVLVPFGNEQMPLYAARLLSVDSYLATTWSIYDRLSNVVGRLMGDEGIVKNSNPAQNPKLVEDLIKQAKGCFQSFGINELLPKLYGEPIYSSYFLRNSFLHDGGMMNNTPILSGSSAAACFELSKEKADCMNRSIAQKLGPHNSSMFKAGDIIGQMKSCHDEIDEMFVSLIDVVVGSICSQVSLFGGKIGVNPMPIVNIEL